MNRGTSKVSNRREAYLECKQTNGSEETATGKKAYKIPDLLKARAGHKPI